MASKKTDARQFIGLKCPKCNYMIRHTEKNVKNTTDKLSLPFLREWHFLTSILY